MREFRPPTRFSRPGADATLAVASLADGRGDAKAGRSRPFAPTPRHVPGAAPRRARGRRRGARARLPVAARGRERARPRATSRILARSFRAPARRRRGRTARAAAFDRLAAAALARRRRRRRRGARGASTARSTASAPRRSPPEEEIRRAGQFLRFLALVPIEYGRGVADGRVTLAFEIQEAITFRDGAAQAFADLESVARRARRRPRPPHRRARRPRSATTSPPLRRAAAVAAEEAVEARTNEALDLAEGIFPEEWKDAGAAADFDVIRTSLDRVVGAVRAGEYAKAEQARLEAYAFFEFGPEQRLRGLAPDLFVRAEGLFWYGADGFPGSRS